MRHLLFLVLAAACGAERSLPVDGSAVSGVIAVYPSHGPYHPGDVLILVGNGFGDPPTAQVVIGEPAPIVRGTENELEVRIPFFPFPGESVTLSPYVNVTGRT